MGSPPDGTARTGAAPSGGRRSAGRWYLAGYVLVRITTVPSCGYAFVDATGKGNDVPRKSSRWSGEPVRTGYISNAPAARELTLPAPIQIARAEEVSRPPRYSWAH